MNASSNEVEKSSGVNLIMNITLMSIGFATVLLNTFVIALILGVKWMKSTANMILCSMAVTDVLAGLATIGAGSVKWTNWLDVRGVFCQLHFSIDGWAAYASLAHVLLVNGERYLAIVFPLKYKQLISRTKVKVILLCVWIITLAEGVVYTFAYKLGEQCLLVGTALPGLAFGILVVSIAVPFVIVIAIYLHIVIVVVKKLRFMAKSSNLNQAALARSQRKMFVIVSVILAAWIVCWLPLMCVIMAINGAQAFHIVLDLGQFVTMLYYVEVMSYANSLLNPILYFLTSSDFRKAAVLLFKCKSSDSNNQSTLSMSTTENTRL